MKKSVLSIGVVVALCSCDGDSTASINEGYTASKPAHPAMTAPVGASSGGAGGGMEGSGSIRPGGGSPPMPTPPPTRSEPASGGLVARLAKFGMSVSIPAGWVEEAPSSGMRLGTLRMPRVEGDPADGEMSIIPAGGSVAANVDRWRGQFQERPAPVSQQLTTPGGVQVTTVEMTGTFSPGGGPMMRQKTTPQPGTVLLGAIAMVPQGRQLVFFKAWGPQNTMEHWKPSFEEFVQSFQRTP